MWNDVFVQAAKLVKKPEGGKTTELIHLKDATFGWMLYSWLLTVLVTFWRLGLALVQGVSAIIYPFTWAFLKARDALVD